MRSESRGTLAVALVVLASRLPFLDAGAGADPDAWRFVEAAHALREEGTYRVSRLPGYPIPELAAALVLPLGTGALTFLVALLTAGAAGAFHRILLRLGSGAWPAALVSIAFAFTPVVYVASVTYMDYAWALAFTLFSLERVLAGRALTAGLWLGLAIGSRLTTVALAPPLGFLLATRAGVRALVPFAVSSLGIAALSYAPVVFSHGGGFLAFRDASRPLREVLSRAGSGVFGRVGVAAIGLAVVWGTVRLVRRRRCPPALPGVDRRVGTAAGAALLIVGLVYARLPLEAGYLVPAVPFVLILLGAIVPVRPFALVAAALVIAPFVGIGSDGPVRGRILRDRAVRQARTESVMRALEAGGRLGPKAVIVVGHLAPELRARAGLDPAARVPGASFVYLLEPKALEAHVLAGREIYVVPGQMEYVGRFVDVTRLGQVARPLPVTARNAP